MVLNFIDEKGNEFKKSSPPKRNLTRKKQFPSKGLQNLYKH